MRHFPKEKKLDFYENFLFQLGEKWFPSFIEHERRLLGVSKLFSELFMKTSWHILNSWGFMSLRYSTDFRRCHLVCGIGECIGHRITWTLSSISLSCLSASVALCWACLFSLSAILLSRFLSLCICCW